MAQKHINTDIPNSGNGDALRDAFNKTEDNFSELYSTKVDKISGKGLSTNDYTTVEKDKLAGIPADAEKNVQADFLVNDPSSDSFIKNKPNFVTSVNWGEIQGDILNQYDLQNQFSNVPTYDYVDSKITQTVNSGITDFSPSEDAVFNTLELKQDLDEKNNANGYAGLDSSGKILVAQLPNSVMEYKGVYDASTNTPTLVDGTGNTGDVYRVTVSGSGVNALSFVVGDYVVYNGLTWEKQHSGGDNVVSVFGRAGVVIAQVGDYTTAQVTEVTDKRYQTDAQRTNNDATSSIQTQLNSKEASLGLGTNTQYLRGDKTWQNIDKAAVGLGNVDNVSDINKPVSTATQTALNGKENSFSKNTAFNKNFGMGSGTVAEGNDSRIINGQTAFSSLGGKANTDGSNASGTWGINISGNAQTWNNLTFTDADNGNSNNILVSTGGSGNWRYRPIASFKSDLGLSNAIIGSGTANYLPEFTSSGTLGNSITRSNSTGLGIGTDTLTGGAGAKWLTIDGTTALYGGGLISSINGVAKAYFYSDNGYASVQGTTGQGVKLTVNSSTDALTILSNGNVGIGTNSPTASVDILKDSNATSFLLRNTIYSFYAGNDATGAFVGGYKADNSGVAPLQLQKFGGNVGVGVQNPKAKIDSESGFQQDAPTLAGAGAYFKGVDIGVAFGQLSDGGGYGSWMQSIRRSDEQSFGLSINPNGGNVLIGTILDNGAKLQVKGGGGVTGTFNVGDFSISGPKGIQILPSTDGTVPKIQGVYAGIGAGNISINEAGGNVLIGSTTDNGAKLQVNGKLTWGNSTYSTGDGQIYNDATLGTVFAGKAGSSYDFQLVNATGQGIMSVPTGTQDVIFNSTISTTGIINKYTSLSATDVFNISHVNSNNTTSGNYEDAGGGAGFYFLETFRYTTADWGMQRITYKSGAAKNKIYVRTLESNVWSAWVEVATKAFVNTALNLKATLAGSNTFTGINNFSSGIVVVADPVNAYHAVPKNYVDSNFQPKLSYKVYTASLAQTGTNAPTATVLDNSIGSIVWTRTGTGTYSGTLSGAFVTGKTTVFINPAYGTGNVNAAQWITTSRIDIKTLNGLSPTDGILTTDIEIRVYQ